MSLGLSEEQESMLIKIVQNGVNKSLDHVEQGIKIDEEMREIINLLICTFD